MKKEQIAQQKGYYVTECGVLIGSKGGRIGFLSNRDYTHFNFRYKGSILKINAHRLQAYQKYGDKIYDKDIVVRHKNNNKLDNSWDNILIGTQSENMFDIPKQIRIKKSVHASSFIKKHNYKSIKEYYNKTKSYNKTMSKFNISSKGSLHYIINK